MCIPIFFGCQDKLKAEGDSTARVCPKCNNASVHSAKATTWFELFWVPLIPFSTKHIWLCQICQWMAPHVDGQFEPALAGGAPPGPQHTPSYQPTYMNAPPASPPNSYQPQYNTGGAGAGK
ncbi:hypothetical protein DFH08DRAFT_842292 [Mycena albidolilacea]|uniref:Zinc-ribbon 15 domain-containing protein n=1 Tax=Mycena albidolilacea TaxID=1033008 RepID=A0AAD7EZT1_9AGAR|nr:hypothetical protein DFH08DRAFT_842292 [Mycena albidolilacea]